MKQSESARKGIAALGTEMGPAMMEGMLALFAEEQTALVARQPALATDIAYGEHPRHRLDIYGPTALHTDLAARKTSSRPVLVFVHGGGFLKGDKGDTTRWYNACFHTDSHQSKKSFRPMDSAGVRTAAMKCRFNDAHPRACFLILACSLSHMVAAYELRTYDGSIGLTLVRDLFQWGAQSYNSLV